jgi:CheY-like chemotaxis protein
MTIPFRNSTLPALAPRPAILIVDADPDTRALYRAIFPADEYDVAECDDGAEALGHALARRPELIITETYLTRIDGYALCRLLRADPITRTVPILVVTSAASSGDAARAAQAGASQVLVKPCDPEAVAEAARRALAPAPDDAPGSREAATAPRLQTAALAPQPVKRRGRSRGFQRHITTTPPAAPPELRCPSCDAGLAYQHSHIGGVNAQASEQWDYFNCRQCGTYQYRHRTRKLKSIGLAGR